MTREELVEKVRALRREIARLNEDPWSPASEQMGDQKEEFA